LALGLGQVGQFWVKINGTCSTPQVGHTVFAMFDTAYRDVCHFQIEEVRIYRQDQP